MDPGGADATVAETVAEGGEKKDQREGDDVVPGPDGAELEATFEWTGVMGYSRDRDPWVGAVPASAGGGEGLFVCGGYTGHGMPAAPLCAREVVRIIAGEREESSMPASFNVSDERLERARRESEVHMYDGLGILARLEKLYADLR